MDYQIKGKTAIVTGGGGGLGAEIVRELMAEGVNVAIADVKTDEKVEKWISDLNEKSESKTVMILTDVSDEEQVDRLFDKALEEFGQVDIVVNNAGIWPTAYVREMTPQSFRKTLDINLVGPFMICKRMANYCIENGRKGKIINMVSQAAFHGSTTGHAHYAASKAGLVTFSISLAREVAKYGITVNMVAPGIMATPMIAESLKDPVKKEAYLNRIPIRKVATTEDVAKIVMFLAGNQSDYMTGTTLDATGGMLMR